MWSMLYFQRRKFTKKISALFIGYHFCVLSALRKADTKQRKTFSVHLHLKTAVHLTQLEGMVLLCKIILTLKEMLSTVIKSPLLSPTHSLALAIGGHIYKRGLLTKCQLCIKAGFPVMTGEEMRILRVMEVSIAVMLAAGWSMPENIIKQAVWRKVWRPRSFLLGLCIS